MTKHQHMYWEALCWWGYLGPWPPLC